MRFAQDEPLVRNDGLGGFSNLKFTGDVQTDEIRGGGGRSGGGGGARAGAARSGGHAVAGRGGSVGAGRGYGYGGRGYGGYGGYGRGYGYGGYGGYGYGGYGYGGYGYGRGFGFGYGLGYPYYYGSYYPYSYPAYSPYYYPVNPGYVSPSFRGSVGGYRRIDLPEETTPNASVLGTMAAAPVAPARAVVQGPIRLTQYVDYSRAPAASNSRSTPGTQQNFIPAPSFEPERQTIPRDGLPISLPRGMTGEVTPIIYHDGPAAPQSATTVTLGQRLAYPAYGDVR